MEGGVYSFVATNIIVTYSYIQIDYCRLIDWYAFSFYYINLLLDISTFSFMWYYTKDADINSVTGGGYDLDQL